jgi:uncharacterized protein (UPF0332 family)
MRPKLFLDLARSLVEISPTDQQAAPSYRTAISRSYYSAYHAAVDFLNIMDFEITEPSRGHDSVKQVFNFCGDPTARFIRGLLATLHTQRRHADYHLNDLSIEDSRTAEAPCEQADEVFTKIETCRSSTTQFEAMREKIKDWVGKNRASGMRNK